MFARRKREEGEDRLKGLQRDSWQLELIVASFAVAGLISGFEEVERWGSQIMNVDSSSDEVLPEVLELTFIVFMFSYIVTVTNLIAHIVLRCLWIAAIGITSVNPRVRIKQLRLAPRFDRFLSRRHLSFEDYIGRLDDYCSLIFAFTFLAIAIIVSFFLWIGAITAVAVTLTQLLEEYSWGIGVLVILVTLLVLSGMIYFIDFWTLGRLKRSRWWSVVYYPLYRLMGWLTLARFYRPFYYNFVSNRRTRYWPLLFVPYVLALLFFSSFSLTAVRYTINEEDDVTHHFGAAERGGRFVPEVSYADRQGEGYVEHALRIPSDIIHQSPLRVSLPLLSEYERYIARHCPELPLVQESHVEVLLLRVFDPERLGFRLADSINVRDYMDCLASPLRLYLDSLPVSLEDVLYQPGVEAAPYLSQLIKYVPLEGLPAGLHYLRLEREKLVRDSTNTLLDSTNWVLQTEVPFYYSPAPAAPATFQRE